MPWPRRRRRDELAETTEARETAREAQRAPYQDDATRAVRAWEARREPRRPRRRDVPSTTLYTWAGQTYVTSADSITFTSIDGSGQRTVAPGGWTAVGSTGSFAPITVTYGNVSRVVQPGDSVTFTVSGDLYGRAMPEMDLMDPEDVERERQARQERQREHAEQVRVERERAARARAVATELLESWLDDEQRESYRRGEGIPVVGSAGTRFRIHTHSHTSNVAVHHPDTGDEVDRVCAHPALVGGLPMPDVHLAQMLAIMGDEREFLRVANWDGRRLPYGSDGRLQFERQADSDSGSGPDPLRGALRRAAREIAGRG